MVRRGRVLIVDDERFNIAILVELLRSNCDTMVAKSGEQALQSVHSPIPPDLILLDIMMPEMDGYEVCRRLKSDVTTGHIPIIFITAMQAEEDETKGFDLGAVDYITKPFSSAVVKARVRTQLNMVMAQNKILSLNHDLEHALIEQKQSYVELKKTRIELAETQAMAVMTRVFEKFVPKQFLSRIARDGLENIKLGTVELSIITVLFNDIRSFAKLAEAMSPEEVFSFLNHYLSLMQTPIEQQGGFVDKFIGDAIMALFDDPHSNQASCAIRAAIGMQQQLSTYNAKQAMQGIEPIQTGTGVHIGPVMLGTIGNENRMDSTVIGDAVNLAARLESLTKFYRCRIIISDDVFKLLEKNEFQCRALDWVVVKGRQKPIIVYEIFDADPEPERVQKQALLETFHQGIQCYHDQYWQEGLRLFQACLSISADDYMSQMYVERCTALLREPPKGHWDGTFIMQYK